MPFFMVNTLDLPTILGHLLLNTVNEHIEVRPNTLMDSSDCHLEFFKYNMYGYFIFLYCTMLRKSFSHE